MNQPTILPAFALSLILVSTANLAHAQSAIPPFSVAGSNGVCPSQSTREDLKSALQQEIGAQLQNYTQNQEQIGSGGQYKIIIIYYTIVLLMPFRNTINKGKQLFLLQIKMRVVTVMVLQAGLALCI